jgi:hypothetical protein
VRFWVQQRLLRAPMPLTGDRALPPDTPWQRDTWVPAFLMALAYEAADGLDRLVAMDRAATRAVAGRGRHSRAAPLVSAHLARGRPRHGGEERHATALPSAPPAGCNGCVAMRVACDCSRHRTTARRRCASDCGTGITGGVVLLVR